MTDAEQQYLLTLLANADPELDPVRKQMALSTLENLIVGDLSGKAAFDIYKVRSQINDDHGKKVMGYGKLLPELELAKAHTVRILWLVFHSVGFRIFVDLDQSKLLGVLSGSSQV